MIKKEDLPIQVKDGDVICLSGSTKFKETFLQIKDLCMDLGALVLTPEVYKHTDNLTFTTYQIEVLNEIHKLKIGLSDYLIVINIDNYIGETTEDEIEFAQELDIPVYYLEQGDIE